MMAYPHIRAFSPQLVERVERAVAAHDLAALGGLDGEVRAFVAALLGRADDASARVLGELAELYRAQLARCETERDALKRSIGAQQRAHAGVTAYRSSGAVSRNA
jgi:hypothetical protein